MTREEAIEVIEQDIPCERDIDLIEALEMAIKALEQEPCNDALSREDVEECIELMTDINGDTVYAVKMSDIRQLPPVNPQEPKTGHWIDHQEGEWIYAKCSECQTIHDTQTNYCPNCGARMESEEV